MFDGKMFFPLTGIPMRKIVCMRSPLALADPVPLTVAMPSAKSLTLAMRARRGRGLHERERVRDLQFELPHVPGGGRAALGAQPAMEAHVLVLQHHALRLRERVAHV